MNFVVKFDCLNLRISNSKQALHERPESKIQEILSQSRKMNLLRSLQISLRFLWDLWSFLVVPKDCRRSVQTEQCSVNISSEDLRFIGLESCTTILSELPLNSSRHEISVRNFYFKPYEIRSHHEYQNSRFDSQSFVVNLISCYSTHAES